MNFDIEDLSRALERLEHVPCVNFGLLQIRQVEQRTGPLEGLLRARALSALIDVQASDDLLCECADSIAACPQWEILLRELLAYAEIAPPTLDVLRLVLMARMPAHPLALRKKPFALMHGRMRNSRLSTVRIAPLSRIHVLSSIRPISLIIYLRSRLHPKKTQSVCRLQRCTGLRRASLRAPPSLLQPDHCRNQVWT